MKKKNKIEGLLAQAWYLRGIGNYNESKKVLNEVESLCNPNDYVYWGRIYHIHMQYAADHNNFNIAIENCKLSISMYQKSKNQSKIAHSVRHLADLQLQVDQPNKAKENYEKCIDLYNELDSVYLGDLANALSGYALLLEKQNQISKPIELWQRIATLYKMSNYSIGEEHAIKKIKSLKSK